MSQATATSAALLAAVARTGVQEDERATRGWQVEWLTVPPLFDLIAAFHGLMLAGALSFAPGRVMTREMRPRETPCDEVRQPVKNAALRAFRAAGHLATLAGDELGSHGDGFDWNRLTRPHTLGVTSDLIGRAPAPYEQAVRQVTASAWAVRTPDPGFLFSSVLPYPQEPL